jgi:predicted CoA-binding protein
MAYLLRAGYRCIPVNPGQTGKEILGQPVVARLADIGEPIDIVDIFRQQFALAGAVDEALALPVKPKAVWMQLDLSDEAAAAKAEAAGVMAVMDRCTKIEHARLR